MVILRSMKKFNNGGNTNYLFSPVAKETEIQLTPTQTIEFKVKRNNFFSK